jgi:hypothetical protein
VLLSYNATIECIIVESAAIALLWHADAGLNCCGVSVLPWHG